MESIKIYISYHRNCDRVRSGILTPIHVGRAISDNETRALLSDMIGDDTGENISDFNPYYCELTAQYWVWKNTSEDYVGFMHYRRHFVFDEKCRDNENEFGLVDYPFICNNYLEQVGLNDETIKRVVPEYDIITMTPWDVSNVGSSDNYDHYKSSSPYLHIEDYEMMLGILRQKYPDYAEDAEAYGNSKFGYYTNMFILRRNLFDDYCDFLFGILSELSVKVDLTAYSEQERRIYGYLSEWMFGIFLTHLKRVGDYKIKELRRTFILHPEISEYDIHCCSACDNNYAKHMGVLITSVKANKGSETLCYWIISDGISETNKGLLKKLESADFQIRIIEQSGTIDPLLQKTLVTNPHLSVVAYNKLYISDYVPPHVDRIIYLDSDMVCRSSLLDLYSSDFDGSWTCGVKDVLHDRNCKRLNLDRYINSGMFLIDCRSWRKNSASQMFLKYISQNINNQNAIFYQDQDVLNSVLKGHIKYVDPIWNAQTSPYKGCEEQNEIGKTAKIIHFISDRKPWLMFNENPFENEYKKYLALSPWSDTNQYVGKIRIEKQQNFIQKYWSVLTVRLFGFWPSHAVRFLMTIDIRIGNVQDLNAFFDHYYLLDDKCAKYAFTFVFPFAESGNPHAMVRVARAYKDGHGVDRDLKRFFEWNENIKESEQKRLPSNGFN